MVKNPQLCRTTDLWAHVVSETESEVLLNVLHAVTVLPLSGAEVFLQRTCHRWEYGESCFMDIHDVRRRCTLVLLLHPPDVSEGFLYSNHQPDREITVNYCRLSFLFLNVVFVQ